MDDASDGESRGYVTPDSLRAILLGAAATVLYLLTAPAVPNPDGLGYLKLLPHNFAAGHLAYMPLLRAATRLLHGDGLAAGRLVDALLGGTGVVVMYGLCRRLLASLPLGRPYGQRDVRFAATLAASGLALSYGYWSEAADVEAYAAATVALLVTLRLLVSYLVRPSLARAIAVGLALGVAVLCHLEHVLLAVGVGAALLRRGPERRGLAHALVALTVGGALALGAYAYAALGVRGHDLAGALAWVRTASHGFVYGGGAYKLADAVYGLAKALVFSPYLYEADAQKLVGQLLLGLLPLVGLGALVWSRRGALPPLPFGVGLVTVLPYIALGVLFFGSDCERWLFVLPFGWLLAAALVTLLPQRRRIGAAIGIYLFAINLGVGLWPAHRDDSVRRRAEEAAHALHAGDLAVFPGHGWDEYVSFYADRPIEPFPIVYYAARDGLDACFARLARDAERVRAAGGRVVALRVFDEEESDPRGWDELAALGLPRRAVQARLRAASISPP